MKNSGEKQPLLGDMDLKTPINNNEKVGQEGLQNLEKYEGILALC